MLRRISLAVAITAAVALTLAACSRSLTPGADAPAASTPAVTNLGSGRPAIAPDTVIDGYLIGLPNPACEQIDNPECAKILNLAKAGTINTADGLKSIADCSLSKAECDRFTGVPASTGFSKRTGLAEVVGLAEEAVLKNWPKLAPEAIVGFGLYDQSHTGWKDASGAYVKNQSAPYYLVVFDFADGTRHVGGVVCGTGECWAHGPDDLDASPPVDVVSPAGQDPLPSPS
jgi:hypothetical protein